MMKQHTIGKDVEVSGVALHTGVRVTLKMLPAPEDTGIVFRRVDMPGAPEVKAHSDYVIDVRRATTIASPSKAYVVTVEHVMAAFHAAGIDNAYVEMDNAEPPICDGSAGPFYRMIQTAGIVEQDKEAVCWTIPYPIYAENGSTTIVALPPAPGEENLLRITSTVAFGSSIIGTQYKDLVITPESFEKELSPCRTFAEYKDLAMLFQMGLAKGGSLDNAVIIHDGAIISNEGLRFPDELVRHKMMDMVGDLYLTGVHLYGHIISVTAGHPIHVALAGKLVKVMRENQK